MSNVPTNLIPTTVTGLPEYTGSSTLGYLPYVVDGRTYKVQFSNIAAVGAVPSSRTVATGTGLTGGGDLSANRTIAIANGGVGTAQLAASGVSAGVYGSGTLVPVLTVDATGRVTSATTAAVSVSGFVPTSRSVIAGTGLTGGGALTSDVTLNVNFSSSTPQALGTATAGVSTAAARGDHVHPAVNLADTSQTQGALPLGRGGTGDALSPVAGAVVYSTGTRFALTALGLPGQVLMSDGANAPQWATVSGIGTVTSVNVSGGTTGLTFSGGPVTAAGTITMAGTLAVGNGGTGLTSLTANFVPKGNGTAAFSASQIFDNGTNVGIGTTSPGTKLDVNGTTRSGNFRVNAGGTVTGAGMWGIDTILAFNTDSTERMRIDSVGNVGIGTASAANKLVVSNAGAAGFEFDPATGILQTYNRATSLYTGLLTYALEQRFFTGTSPTERMRVTSAGDVGIGTTSPGARLHVSGGNVFVTTSGTYSEPATIAGVFAFDSANGDLNISARSNGGNTLTRFWTSNAGVGAERMRITNTGLVGIGTTSPGYRLDVANSDGSALARFKDSDSAHNGVIIAGDTNGGWVGNNAQILGEGIYYQNSISGMRLYTNSLERMRITDTGRVGIGTTSPEATLTVTGTAGAITGAGFAVVESSTGNNARLRIFQSAGFVTYDATYSSGGNQQVWSNAGVERMRLTEAGNLGIGTSAPSAKLSVGDAAAAKLNLMIGAAERAYIDYTEATALMRIDSDAAVAFNTNNTERMRITSTGNLQLGTASLATTATNGFPYIPTCAGIPTGTPTAITGYAPMVVDSTNNKLYVYVGGAWQAMN